MHYPNGCWYDSQGGGHRHGTPPLQAKMIKDLSPNGLSRSKSRSVTVFGRADSGFGGWNYFKQELDAHVAGTVAPWTLHDLRRTVATRMAEL